MASAQADQLNAYLKSSGWAAGGGRGGMAVHVLAAPGCQTEGEALRLVEERDVVKEDFVLVSGGVVANADLRPAVHAHMARRAADRQAIMTLVLHSGAARGAAAAAAAARERLLAVVDPASHQLLKLEQGGRAGAASLSTHMLGERNSVAVRFGCRCCCRRAVLCAWLACKQLATCRRAVQWVMACIADGSPHPPHPHLTHPTLCCTGLHQPAPVWHLRVRPRRPHAAQRQLRLPDGGQGPGAGCAVGAGAGQHHVHS